MDSFLPEKLVMVDCEMTGVDETEHELLQAAFVKLELSGNQYVEVGEPLVLYFKHDGVPQNDFHKKYLTHIFEKCNQSDLCGEQANRQLEDWLGDWVGEVTPTGDCVHCDLAFLKVNGVVRRNDIIDEKPAPGTFHYEAFELNPLKAFARTVRGEKYAVADIDEENIHDALVDCRNQTKELNSYLDILLPGRTHTTAGLSDRDEELFSQGGCWDLALELEREGLEFAVLQEFKYGDHSHPHAFAIDGDVAVDIYGRVPLSKMVEKWSKLLGNEVEVLRGAKAKEITNVRANPSLVARAKELIEEYPKFFFGKKSEIESYHVPDVVQAGAFKELAIEQMEKQTPPEQVFDIFKDQKDAPDNKDLKRFEEYAWTHEQFPLDQVTVNGGALISEPMWSEGYNKPQEPWDLEKFEDYESKTKNHDEEHSDRDAYLARWSDEWHAREYSKLTTKAPPVFIIWDDKEHRYRMWNGRHRCRAAWLRGERTIDAYVGRPAKMNAASVQASALDIHLEPFDKVKEEIKKDDLLIDGEYGSYTETYWLNPHHPRNKPPEQVACLRDDTGKLIGWAGVGLYQRLPKKNPPGWKTRDKDSRIEPWRGNLQCFVNEEERGQGNATRLALIALKDFKARHPEVEDVYWQDAFSKGEDLIEQAGLYPEKWGGPRAAASAQKELNVRRRIKSADSVDPQDLPEAVKPSEGDDGQLPDEKKEIVNGFQRQALRADSFQDFQVLLDQIMLDARLTEEYRPSVAGLLNEYRTAEGYVAL